MIDLKQTTIDGRGDWKYWVFRRSRNYIIKCTDSKKEAYQKIKDRMEQYIERGNYMYHDTVIIIRHSKDDWSMIYGEDIVGLTYWDYIKYKIDRIKRILGL